MGRGSLWSLRRFSLRQYLLVVSGLLIVAGGIALFAATPAQCSQTLSAGANISTAMNSASPGSVVCLSPGTYSAASITHSGASGSPITLTSADSANPATISGTLAPNANYITVSNLNISGSSGDCVTISPALTSITIQNTSISGCGRDGIHFTRPENTGANYTTNVSVIGNKISNVGVSNSAGNNLTIYANSSIFQSNDLSKTNNDAIDFWGDSLTFRQNNIHDISNTNGNHNDGMQTWTGYSPSDGAQGRSVTNLVVDRNVFHNITGSNAHCFIAEGPGDQNWKISNNLFWNNGTICWILDTNDTSGNPPEPGILNVQVYNNTFVGAASVDTIEFNSGTTGKMVNNIFYNTAGSYFKVPGNIQHDYNLTSGSPSLSEAHGVTANPQFVNASSDFHLQSTSPAVNAGDNGAIINPVRTADLDGNSTQGNVDIGAYEYQPGGSSDVTPPSVPTGLAGTATSTTSIALTWNASTDGSGSGMAGYHVYRGSTLIASPASNAYTDTGLTAATSYTYTVSAYDNAANNSTASSPITVATQSNLQYSCTGVSAYICDDFSSNSSDFTTIGGTWAVGGGLYNLTNPAAATDANKLLYNKALNTKSVNGDFTLTFDGSTPSTGAYADFGAIFDYVDENNYYYIDYNKTDDQTTNGILKVSGGAQTKLADFPVTMNSDTTYSTKIVRTGSTINVYRNNVLLASATDATFNSGKVGLGSRNDPASFDSLVVLASSGDTQAPTVPAGLTATAPSSSQINLSWSASSDNIGVTGYKVYRNGAATPIATVTTPSFGDSGLLASTSYTYTVSAIDAAGNQSTQSSTVTATTQATAATVTVSGTVSDSSNASPIAGANIHTGTHGTKTGAASATTNASGQYVLSGITPGGHSYSYSATNYKSQSFNLNFPAGSFIKNVSLVHR